MKDDALDSLVTRLYRAAMSISDTGWQELLKNAAFSLSAGSARGERGAALVAAVALTDTVLVLAEHAHHLDGGLTAALRQGLREALGKPATPSIDTGLGASAR
ncbi:MAG: hypothetical protein Q8L48_04090 [Archangium sp.]|nr:hypothetical protein [Archangium sp.]